MKSPKLGGRTKHILDQSKIFDDVAREFLAIWPEAFKQGNRVQKVANI